MTVTLQFIGGADSVTGSKYLVRSGTQSLLVDCGLFQGFKQLRLRNWDPLPVKPDSIDAVILTHAHLDHAGGTAELARRSGVPIEGPQQDDQFWIEQMPAQARMFGFPPSERFTPDRWLHQDDRVTVGELELQVRHCPGHTPGHVVFFEPESRFAFVGDVLFAGSIGRTDFPRGNHAQLIASIRHNLFPLGDDVGFLPGHGPTSTFGAERRSNPFVADSVVGRA